MSRARRIRNWLATAWMVGAFVLALVPLAFVLEYVVVKGSGLISWSFLTQVEPFDFTQRGGGFWNGIKGTIKLVVLASAIAIPVGLGCAVWLVEYGRGWFANTVRFVADVMTGVPSVFVGVFVYSFLVLRTGHFSAWTGAVALGLLMVPIIVRGSEEVLRLVPGDLREASLALGVPRWRTAIKVVVPTAASSLVTVTMLAVARAAGETAPLLFTSFGSRVVTGWTQFNGPDSALPLLIYRDARSAYAPAQERAWAGALVLITLVLVLSITARLITTWRGRNRS
jgi:phosphate transport system permease protein